MDGRETKLQQAIRRFGEAWASGDVATLDALLSPTYTHTDLFGAFHEDELAEICDWTGRARDQHWLSRP